MYSLSVEPAAHQHIYGMYDTLSHGPYNFDFFLTWHIDTNLPVVLNKIVCEYLNTKTNIRYDSYQSVLGHTLPHFETDSIAIRFGRIRIKHKLTVAFRISICKEHIKHSVLNLLLSKYFLTMYDYHRIPVAKIWYSNSPCAIQQFLHTYSYLECSEYTKLLQQIMYLYCLIMSTPYNKQCSILNH